MLQVMKNMFPHEIKLLTFLFLEISPLECLNSVAFAIFIPFRDNCSAICGKQKLESFPRCKIIL